MTVGFFFYLQSKVQPKQRRAMVVVWTSLSPSTVLSAIKKQLGKGRVVNMAGLRSGASSLKKAAGSGQRGAYRS